METKPRLPEILSAFHTVQTQLTEFVEEQTQTNKQLQHDLTVGKEDVSTAQLALKQIRKITGK